MKIFVAIAFMLANAVVYLPKGAEVLRDQFVPAGCRTQAQAKAIVRQALSSPDLTLAEENECERQNCQFTRESNVDHCKKDPTDCEGVLPWQRANVYRRRVGYYNCVGPGGIMKRRVWCLYGPYRTGDCCQSSDKYHRPCHGENGEMPCGGYIFIQ